MKSIRNAADFSAPRSLQGAEPAPSWTSALAQSLTRSYRSFVDSLSSSQALRNRAVAVPPPFTGARADSIDTKDAKAVPDSAPERPATLASVWPGHVFGSHSARTACESLIAQQGQWNPKAIHKTLARLDGKATTEVGEFCAYLQADPSLRSCRPLSAVLAEVAGRPSWPLSELQGELPGLPLAGELAIGLARGLARSDQEYSLRQFVLRLLDRDRTLDLGCVVQAVIEMQDQLTDPLLRSALRAVQAVALENGGGVARHLHHQASLGAMTDATLHRLVRLGTPGPGQGLEDRNWFSVLGAPHWRGDVLRPSQEFTIGHALATALSHSPGNLQRLRLYLDPQPGAYRDPAYDELPPPTAGARAGVLWAVEPLQRVAQLPRTPGGEAHLQAWAALPAHLRSVDPVRWYRTVEALDIPMAQRYRLQRMALAEAGAFASVRAALLPQPAAAPVLPSAAGPDEGPGGAPASPPHETDATLLALLSDLYRYFGEREDLEFAFASPPDLPRIRQADALVRQRIDAIEDAIRELVELPAFQPRLARAAPDSKSEPVPDTFLRDGVAKVAQVTLGRSLETLRAARALAWPAADTPAGREGKG